MFAQQQQQQQQQFNNTQTQFKTQKASTIRGKEKPGKKRYNTLINRTRQNGNDMNTEAAGIRPNKQYLLVQIRLSPIC